MKTRSSNVSTSSALLSDSHKLAINSNTLNDITNNSGESAPKRVKNSETMVNKRGKKATVKNNEAKEGSSVTSSLRDPSKANVEVGSKLHDVPKTDSGRTNSGKSDKSSNSESVEKTKKSDSSDDETLFSKKPRKFVSAIVATDSDDESDGNFSDWLEDAIERKEKKLASKESKKAPLNLERSNKSTKVEKESSIQSQSTRPRKTKTSAVEQIKRSSKLEESLSNAEEENKVDWDSDTDVPKKKKKRVSSAKNTEKEKSSNLNDMKLSKTVVSQTKGIQKKSAGSSKKESACSKKAPLKKKQEILSEGDESDSDGWEEVAGVNKHREFMEKLKRDEISHEGITVVVEKDKDEAFKNYVAQVVRKARKLMQINVHKSYLVCFCAAGRYRNEICNSPLLKALLLSLLPKEFVTKSPNLWNVESLKNFDSWFSKVFKIEENNFGNEKVSIESLISCINKRCCPHYSQYVMLFVVAMRSLGFQCRLTWNCQPPVVKTRCELTECEQKLTDKILKDRELAEKERRVQVSKSEAVKSEEKVSPMTGDPSSSDHNLVDSDDEDFDEIQTNSVSNETDIRALLMQTENYEGFVQPTCLIQDEKVSSYFKKENVVTSGIDKVKNNKSNSSSSSQGGKNPKGKKNDSSESDALKAKDVGVQLWVEVYLKKESCWIPVSPVDKLFNKPYVIEKHTCNTVCYVFSFDNYNRMKDVTKRYALKWGSVNQKLRVEWTAKSDGSKWFKSFCDNFAPLDKTFETKEDIQITDQMSNMPIPATVAELKDHPLYALERHLLKYEVIHPKTAPILGYVRSEPVFSRKCVKVCHTEVTWLKEGMGIKTGEQPVKYVRPLISKLKLRKMEGKEVPLAGLYGDWQVELYQAPPVVDGRIPRNEYGNVNLFKMHMLPPGSVYLDLPGLDKVARDLDVDCVSAMRGWDFSGFRARPVLEGFVVCAENEQLLRDCWIERKREAESKMRETRALANWKKIIRSLKISQIIKRKYEYSNEITSIAGNSRNDQFEVL